MFTCFFAFAGNLFINQSYCLSFEIRQIADGNFVHYGVHDERSKTNLGDNANIGFIVGDTCVLVVDAGGSLSVGQLLRQAIRKTTTKPICFVVVTHAHPDHFFGAAAFKEDKPKYIGHAGLYSQLRIRERFYKKTLLQDLGDLAKGSEIIKPDIIIEAGNTLTISLGKQHDIVVKAWQPAHTDHDLTVFDKRSDVFWTGDLLFVNHVPILDFSIKSFINVMKELSMLSVANFVPGHGVPQLSWLESVNNQLSYLNIVLVETRDAIKSGLRLMDAVHVVGWTEKAEWISFDSFHRRNVTTAWTELEWE